MDVTEAGGSPGRIAFGRFDPWEKAIRRNLDRRYAPQFVDLAEACLDEFDAAIPLARRHYDALASRPDLRGRKFILPSPQVVTICHDKLALANFLIDKGFGEIVPPIRPAGAPYPYIWKRRWGGWGLQCHVVDGPRAEQGFDLTDKGWFAQSLAPGPVEYATHMLRTGGKIAYASTFIYQMADSKLILGERHAPIAVRFVRGCDYLALFTEILARLDYEGTACFDYKVVDGRPFLFEINPRYGASLNWDVTAYVAAYLAALQRGFCP